jgi:hypothetical protein
MVGAVSALSCRVDRIGGLRGPGASEPCARVGRPAGAPLTERTSGPASQRRAFELGHLPLPSCPSLILFAGWACRPAPDFDSASTEATGRPQLSLHQAASTVSTRAVTFFALPRPPSFMMHPNRFTFLFAPTLSQEGARA